MAEEEVPWNKINIPFPAAVSFTRIPVDQTTGSIVSKVLEGINKTLMVLESEILQTEIRVLYDLLYVVNNNLGKHKTTRVLKQVEQCINRLKMMKLDVALHDLMDLCPRTSYQNECAVPSQPVLEWACLKVLGAAQLMTCVLNHCSRAFVRSKQHVNSREFVVVNVVTSSMLSRMWVFFRGLLVQLAPLYQLLLALLGEVSRVQPMPYLTRFSLPADVAQFLGPSDTSLLSAKPPKAPSARATEEERRRSTTRMKSSKKKLLLNKAVKKQAGPTQEERRQCREEFGHVVKRAKASTIVDMKSLLKGISDSTKASTEERSSPPHPAEVAQKTRFRNRVKAATSFSDVASHLEDMIPWCKAHGLPQEKRCLEFLRLKCRKMKGLEAAGYNVHRKLRSLKQEVCWASSPKGSVPRTCLSVAALWRSTRHRTRLQSLRARCRPTASQRLTKRTVSSAREEEQGSDEGSDEAEFTPQTAPCQSNDEIEDIFASVGFF